MSTSSPSFDPGPPASAYWRGWPEVRADLRASVHLVLVLGLAGIPAGLVWWSSAPRAVFRITEAGPEPVGFPSAELLIADDAVFVLVLAVAGLLAGAVAWRLRRRRGVATVVAVAMGAFAAALVAWQVGELLGVGPTQAQIEDVGALVTTPLRLGSAAALAVAPFLAVLVYVIGALKSDDDGIGRPVETGQAGADGPASGPAVADPERPLVDVPPAGPQT